MRGTAHLLADNLNDVDPQSLQVASSKTIGLLTGSVELRDEGNGFVEAMVDVNLFPKPANSKSLGHQMWEAPHKIISFFSTFHEARIRALMLRSQDDATLLEG